MPPFTAPGLREMATTLSIEAARTLRLAGMEWMAEEYRLMAERLQHEAAQAEADNLEKIDVIVSDYGHALRELGRR